MLDMVLFRSGEHRLALMAHEVGGSRRPGASHAQACHPAIESLFDLPEPATRAQPMLITLKVGDRGFLADGPVELCRLADEAIHPLPPLLALCCRLRGLRALAFDCDGPVLIFSATG